MTFDKRDTPTTAQRILDARIDDYREELARLKPVARGERERE